ncbi:MAG: hypothetical protein KBD66_03400 [Candidatus Doudnabacteria bacterium]|nr:hypothetical protein [Candidatus Doudnabacteria bacterium]
MDEIKEVPSVAAATAEAPPASRPRVSLAFAIIIPLAVLLAGVALYAIQQMNVTSTEPTGPGTAINGGMPTPALTSTPSQLGPTDQVGNPEQWVTVQWFPELKGRNPECAKNGYCDQDISLAGKVTSGPYAGKDVYIELQYSLGTSVYHFVKDGETRINFEDTNIKIRGIADAPDTIAWKDSGYVLSKGWVSQIFADVKRLPIPAFTDPTFGPVYIAQDQNCFFVELPDHTALGYDVVLPFITTGTPEAPTAPKLAAAWSDGKQRSDSYTYTIPTCGGLCALLNFQDVKTLKPDTRLTAVAKTSNGDTLYGIANGNDMVLKDLYNDKNSMAYMKDPASGDYAAQPQSRYTYAQFLGYYPLVYWKDPLGRWVEFKNERFVPAAEMCKPVIYLYPTKTQDVDVYVVPNGGLTKTIPAYGTGWHVTAHPDGRIVNKADGKEYPYLFWEGIGMQYPRPTTGFVVPTQNAGAFFDATLPKLGLQEKEIADFKEYWVPRLAGLQGTHALLHFMTKEEFTALAPLKVGPTQPDTIIRVMMTARVIDPAVERPTQQQLPKTPVRAGFAFVEWGGAIVQ